MRSSMHSIVVVTTLAAGDHEPGPGGWYHNKLFFNCIPTYVSAT